MSRSSSPSPRVYKRKRPKSEKKRNVGKSLESLKGKLTDPPEELVSKLNQACMKIKQLKTKIKG